MPGSIAEAGGLKLYKKQHNKQYRAENLASLAELSLIHISEPTRPYSIPYAVCCVKKKYTHKNT